MVVGFDYRVVMGDDHLICLIAVVNLTLHAARAGNNAPPHNRADGGALGQFDFLNAPSHHLRRFGVAVRHQFQRFGRTAAQRVYRCHVAPAHAREQRTDSGLCR